MYIAFFSAILPIIIHFGLWLLLALRARNESSIVELSRARADLKSRKEILDEMVDLESQVGLAEVKLDMKKRLAQWFRDTLRKAREKVT